MTKQDKLEKHEEPSFTKYFKHVRNICKCSKTTSYIDKQDDISREREDMSRKQKLYRGNRNDGNVETCFKIILNNAMLFVVFLQISKIISKMSFIYVRISHGFWMCIFFMNFFNYFDFHCSPMVFNPVNFSSE